MLSFLCCCLLYIGFGVHVFDTVLLHQHKLQNVQWNPFLEGGGFVDGLW